MGNCIPVLTVLLLTETSRFQWTVRSFSGSGKGSCLNLLFTHRQLARIAVRLSRGLGNVSLVFKFCLCVLDRPTEEVVMFCGQSADHCGCFFHFHIYLSSFSNPLTLLLSKVSKITPNE